MADTKKPAAVPPAPTTTPPPAPAAPSIDIDGLTDEQLAALQARLALRVKPTESPPPPAPIVVTTEVAPHGTITQVIG